ncbi:TadE/TadG family type IV pilus assembly protein [Sphingomonas mucosissima]|uniref:TadE-like protein n=1 Tax=Sphingomonas mucosissima TaxID=370959 RepID=A0A245ZTA6_9SPHN|nr:TadE/TadG family type IV pilus assembly protein [Sphingomonas mucosissima]OWK32985.1 TadE-like protein [Sphingomonas mucosissima]
MKNGLLFDKRGATVVEFAIILPVLCGLLAGGLELAYRAYFTAILESAMLEASRRATIGDQTGEQIDSMIRDRIANLSRAAEVKAIKKESFFNFSNVGKPEKITADTDPIGQYNRGDCYEDANNNGVYDTISNTGLGTADDVVRYTVTVQYSNIMPVAQLFGWGSKQTIVGSTVLRNQPFTSRAQPTIRCD